MSLKHSVSADSIQLFLFKLVMSHDTSLQSAASSQFKIQSMAILSPQYFALVHWMYCSLLLNVSPSRVNLQG